VAIVDVDVQTLRQMIETQPDLVLVDVRTPEEYEYLGHIPQALLMPLHELPVSYNRLSRDQKLVLLCQHGVRSQNACYFLEQAGFPHLYNLMDGMSVWDGPVERKAL
jgi:rhodanese-related sulfurtransferase